MAHILILYGTNEGQTEKIAGYMADVIRERDHAVTLVHGKHLPADFSLTEYDGVIVGASIHAGKYQNYIVSFARKHRAELAELPSAFFTVCLTAATADAEHEAQVAQFVANFEEQTGWHPTLSVSFAGALPYTRYNFFKRLIMKRIVAQDSGDTDTSRDYEYTDWDAVTAFAETYLRSLAAVPA